MKNIWTKLEKKCHTIFLKNMSTFSPKTSWKKLALQILLMETLEAEIVWITISTKNAKCIFSRVDTNLHVYQKSSNWTLPSARVLARRKPHCAYTNLHVYQKLSNWRLPSARVLARRKSHCAYRRVLVYYRKYL